MSNNLNIENMTRRELHQLLSATGLSKQAEPAMNPPTPLAPADGGEMLPLGSKALADNPPKPPATSASSYATAERNAFEAAGTPLNPDGSAGPALPKTPLRKPPTPSTSRVRPGDARKTRDQLLSPSGKYPNTDAAKSDAAQSAAGGGSAERKAFEAAGTPLNPDGSAGPPLPVSNDPRAHMGPAELEAHNAAQGTPSTPPVPPAPGTPPTPPVPPAPGAGPDASADQTAEDPYNAAEREAFGDQLNEDGSVGPDAPIDRRTGQPMSGQAETYDVSTPEGQQELNDIAMGDSSTIPDWNKLESTELPQELRTQMESEMKYNERRLSQMTPEDMKRPENQEAAKRALKQKMMLKYANSGTNPQQKIDDIMADGISHDELMTNVLDDPAAMEKLKETAAAQGQDPAVVEQAVNDAQADPENADPGLFDMLGDMWGGLETHEKILLTLGGLMTIGGPLMSVMGGMGGGGGGMGAMGGLMSLLGIGLAGGGIASIMGAFGGGGDEEAAYADDPTQDPTTDRGVEQVPGAPAGPEGGYDAVPPVPQAPGAPGGPEGGDGEVPRGPGEQLYDDVIADGPDYRDADSIAANQAPGEPGRVRPEDAGKTREQILTDRYGPDMRQGTDDDPGYEPAEGGRQQVEAAPPAEAAPAAYPGDTDGDGKISPQESAAAGKDPAVLGQMINHPNAATMMAQQYKTDKVFKAKIDKIRTGMKWGMDRQVLAGVQKELGVSKADAQKMIRLATTMKTASANWSPQFAKVAKNWNSNPKTAFDKWKQGRVLETAKELGYEEEEAAALVRAYNA